MSDGAIKVNKNIIEIMLLSDCIYKRMQAYLVAFQVVSTSSHQQRIGTDWLLLYRTG